MQALNTIINVNHSKTNVVKEQNNTITLLENIKSIGSIELLGIKIYYYDDKWDMSGITEANLPPHSNVLDFTKVQSNDYRTALKDYILLELLRNRKGVTTLHNTCWKLVSFLNALHNNGCKHLSELTSDLVDDYIKNINGKEPYKAAIVSTITDFLANYNIFKEKLDSKVFTVLENAIDNNLLEAGKINGKSKNIPEKYFNQLLAACIKVMNDAQEQKLYRGLAALLIIETQVGLRTGELFALEIDSVEEIAPTNGNKAFKLKYKTWKNRRGFQPCTQAFTYMNSLAYKAYSFLKELYKGDRNRLGTTYLFLVDEKVPITPDRAFRLLKKYYKHINKYFQTIYDEPEASGEALHRIEIQYKKKPTQYLECPTFHQYRVHLCSALYQKGVPLEYIEKYMSHLSKTMFGYYARPKCSVQENMDFSMKVLKDMITKKAIPIGAQKGLMEKIDEFVERNHYDVKSDLEEICRELAKQVPIRAKVGGVCIKSSMFRECSTDNKTNDLYCAYGACPNIFTFYYHANVTLRKIEELEEILKANKVRSANQQVQKCENMITSIVNNQLQPEIEQLKERISVEGTKAIIEEHPQLKEIIDNLDSIEEKIKQWKK